MNDQKVKEEVETPSIKSEATHRSTLFKGLSYLVVGGLSALIELLLFGIIYNYSDTVSLANPIAVSCATAFNFLINRKVTFGARSNFVRSLVLYLALFMFNLIITTVAISLLIGAGWPAMLAKLLTMACVVAWNFILYNKVIFK